MARARAGWQRLCSLIYRWIQPLDPHHWLYKTLEHTQKKELLINVVERVVVNLEGEIERVDLLPPFAYLYEICEKVQDGEETSENASETQTGDMVATCSSQVLLGDPGRTRTFNLTIKSRLLCQLSYRAF